MKRIDPILTEIAQAHLNIPTLKYRKSDSADFYEVSVWAVRSALRAAFDCGVRAERTRTATPIYDLPARFDDYEIHGVRAYGKGSKRHCEQVDDSQAEFWSLFGHIPGQGLDCIGDFATREHAEEVFSRITGRRYAEHADKTGTQKP